MTGDRPRQEADDGFAMIQLIMMMMLVGTLSLTLLAQLTTEIRQTAFSRKHQQTVNTALGGINAGLTLIRDSVNSSGQGVRASLPCTTGSNRGTITGTVDPAGRLSYTTEIFYLSTDPSQMTPAQVAANAMTCPLAGVPRHAYLLAAGSQAALPGAQVGLGNRTVHAVYDFTTTTGTNVGGQIAYNGSCWDAGSAPTVGSGPTWQPCGPTGTASQQWYYRPDLTLQWMGNPAANLCLDRSAAGPLPTTNYVTLRTCLGSGLLGTAFDMLARVYVPSSKINQEFPTQDGWAVATSSGGRDDGACITSYGGGLLSRAATGDRLVVARTPDCEAGTAGAGRAASTSTVGAGAASGVTSGYPGPTQQFANLGYANRCLDIREGRTYLERPLLVYTCGQSPDYAIIPGNKRYGYVPVTATTGQVLSYSNDPTTPQSDPPTCFDSAGTYVRTRTCVAGRAEQLWTLTGRVENDYPGSYLIRDHAGNCLTADPPNERFNTIGPTSIQACTGAATQKWNAPPGGAQTEITGVTER